MAHDLVELQGPGDRYVNVADFASSRNLNNRGLGRFVGAWMGQGGPRIDNPLFLDTAPGEVQITSNEVFIPSSELQPSRLNRDYYKIGVGVNLTELFNRNKTRPK